jgi:hypothetical protein
MGLEWPARPGVTGPRVGARLTENPPQRAVSTRPACRGLADQRQAVNVFRAFQSCMNMYGFATVTTAVVDADAGTADTAEPRRIDAAALSARIAGMTACLMRMISSMASIQVSGLLHALTNPPAPLSYV